MTPPRRPTRLEVALAGDRRLAEDVILEVRALAQQYGLPVPEATIVKATSAPGKKRTTRPRRRARRRT